MTDERIERVARAIALNAVPEGFWKVDVKWPDDWNKEAQEDIRRQAKAAIEAMRKPEPEDAELWDCPICGQFVDRAMIDKALKDE